jgi:predicted MFS family arabinose efflux permease
MLFGLFWFAGSALIGLMYDKLGVYAVSAFSVAVQGAAFVYFLKIFRIERKI